jgi:hypothetical protein
VTPTACNLLACNLLACNLLACNLLACNLLACNLLACNLLACNLLACNLLACACRLATSWACNGNPGAISVPSRSQPGLPRLAVSQHNFGGNQRCASASSFCLEMTGIG